MTDHFCPPEHPHAASSNCYAHHKCRCTDCHEHFNATRRRIHRDHAYGRFVPRFEYGPALGTRRRLQALARIGWCNRELGERLGVGQARVSDLTTGWRGDNVTPQVERRVNALFRELWDQQPPRRTTAEKFAASRAQANAIKRGWAGPLDWDDIDHDPEPANPLADLDVESPAEIIDEVAVELAVDGGHPKLTTAERHEAMRILVARKYNDIEISALLDVNERTVLRDRKLLDLPTPIGHDRMPIAS